MSDLKLYNYFRSSTSYRVRCVLEFKELKYAYLPVHLVNDGGEQNKDAYRKLNPVGGMPTLDHNGRIISQSMAIAEYLEETFSNTNKIFPTDPYLKAKCRQICETINADIHPLQNLKVTGYLEKELKVSIEQKEKWLQKWIGDGLVALEKTLTPLAGKFALGDEVSAADMFIIPQLFSAQRFKVDFSNHTNLIRINENALSLDLFKKAHPFRQPDTPAELALK